MVHELSFEQKQVEADAGTAKFVPGATHGLSLVMKVDTYLAKPFLTIHLDGAMIKTVLHKNNSFRAGAVRQVHKGDRFSATFSTNLEKGDQLQATIYSAQLVRVVKVTMETSSTAAIH